MIKNILWSKDMSSKDRQKMYKETQSSIIRMMEKDVASSDEAVKRAALNMLEFLLNTKSEHVQTEIIKRLNDNTENKIIQSLFEDSVKKRLSDSIRKKEKIVEILSPWQNQNITLLTNIVEDICLNLPRDKCKYFFVNEVIHAMMSTNTDENVRNILIDIAFTLTTIVPISELTSQELSSFLEVVNNKYIAAITNLRDRDYANWHSLWIFLIRFCDKKIHHSMDLTNRLLRVVEFAFRSTSVNQRLKGYDCWKELIDNASLDINHICSPKQIKLLITPLRAKFSKQEVVICRRFDVFVYLLGKLQHKAVLCLKEFLEFCFGPVGDTDDASRTGQGKSVPELWPKSTKVLMEIIGHSHGTNVECLPTGKLDIESKRMQVLKCMWISIFNLINPPSEMKAKYFQLLADILDNYIDRSNENPYFEDLLGLIFTVLISFDKDSSHQIHEVIHLILKQLLTIFFTIENIPPVISDHFKKIISHSFSQIMLKEDKMKMMDIMINCFTNFKANHECVSNVAKMWLCLISELISDLAVENIEGFEKFREFFLWPAHNLHSLDEKSRRYQIVLQWMKLYKKLSSDDEDKKIAIMKHLETIFKNNPLLAPDVVSLLNVMSQFERKFTKEFVIKLIDVLSSVLVLPNLKTEDEQKITALLMQYFEPTFDCYKPEDNDEVIKVVCTCVKHILCIHEGFKLLDPLGSFIRNCPKDMRNKFCDLLESLLLDLYNKESDTKSYNAKELSKVLGVFSEKDPKENKETKQTFAIPSGRSARIANLVKNSPKISSEPQKSVPSPAALRLFGKDPETMSPLRARGSQLNNTSSPRTKKIMNTPQSKKKATPSIYEENSSDFVKIDTEVKFQPGKLSEHQKEVMKKRREDIPALYQDLSQSLSQDVFSSKSNSKEANENMNIKENPKDNRKVIVEMLDPNPPNINWRSMEFEITPEPENDRDIEANTDIPKKKLENIELGEKINSETDLFSEDIKGFPVEDVKSGGISGSSKGDGQPDMEKVIPNNCDPAQQQRSDSDMFRSAENDLKKEEMKKIPDTVCEGNSSKFSSNHTDHNKPSVSNIDEDKTSVKKKSRIANELERLKMDIVGADKFLETSKRTRRKEKPKEDDVTETSGKKIETRRNSTSLDRPGSIVEKNRRKTIGVIENDDKVPPISQGQHYKTVEQETPAGRRKPMKLQEVKTDKIEQKPENNSPKYKRKSMKLQAVTHTEPTETLSFDNKKTNGQKIPAQKRLPMKLQKVHPTEDEDIMSKTKGTEQQKLSEQEKPELERPFINIAEETAEVEQGVSSIADEEQAHQNEITKQNTDDMALTNDIKDPSEIETRVDAIQGKQLLFGHEPNDALQNIGDMGYSGKTFTLDSKRLENMPVKNIEVEDEETKEPPKKDEVLEIWGIKVCKRRGEKRKYSTDDEDIIESSQESFADVTPLLNSSKKKQIKLGTEHFSDEKTLVQQRTVTAADFISEMEDTYVKQPEMIGETEIIPQEPPTEDHTKEWIEPEPTEKVPLEKTCGDPVVEAEEVKEPDTLKDANSTQDTTLTHETSQDSSQVQDSTQDSIQADENIQSLVGTQDTMTQPTSTQETLTQQDRRSTIEDNHPPTLYFDLPKKPQLTESEQMMCRMDTMSICGEKGINLENRTGDHQSMQEIELRAVTGADGDSIEKMSLEDILATPSTTSGPSSPLSSPNRTSSLPSSPVTFDTPTRTSKLLDDTMDISPITSSRSSPVVELSPQIPMAASLFFPEELNELEPVKSGDEASAEKGSEADNEASGEQEGDSFSDDYEDIQNEVENIKNVLAHKEPLSIQEVENFHKVQAAQEDGSDPGSGGDVRESIENVPVDKNALPQNGNGSRNKDPSTTIQERSSKLLNMINVNSPIAHNFFRKRPGGTTSSPSAGRIRKLMSILSPKQTIDLAEEINEDDILTFSREIPSPLALPKTSILKRKYSDTSDAEGTPCAKRKRVNFCDPCLTSKKLFIKDDFQPSLEAKRLFDPILDPKIDDNLKDIFDFHDEVSPLASSDQLTETENIETEPSLDMLNPMILRRDRPIYPKLVECKEDVLVILKRVTSPMFITTLMNKLKSKNIKTVGDLAQQSEAEINRFPFKVPVVANVYKALDNYYKKKGGHASTETGIGPKTNGVKESQKRKEEEFQRSLRATKENYPIEDLAKTVLTSLDKQKVISLVKNHQSSISALDILEEKDHNTVFNHISERLAISEIVNRIRENRYANRNEEFFNSLTEYVLSVVPLTFLLKSRNVENIKESLEQNNLGKKEVIENCLLPLIDSPGDISTYLNSISMVDFERIVIQRLENENLGGFLARIKEAQPECFSRAVCENNLVSPVDLTTSFRNLVDSCSEDARTRIMTETFKFISEKLDVSTLVGLHMEFLKKIPSILSKQEK
ncbi:hypothetical protein JTB14_025987 [Gonioctena quinquepunctata]|nr:hypothetical protein JTB14_025987 [Gonioctena quinquepunctata]